MRYETGTILGRGGMGEVYKAWDPRLERHVALKVLRVYSEEASRRLLREARAQASLDHPNICPVFEVGEDPEQPYISMLCIDGEPLDRAARRMSLEQRVRTLATVAGAVHEAHRIGLIHRDLKPGNILVEEVDGGTGFRPWVVDFGLVHRQDGTCLTADGAILGTPPYMAPEQAHGNPGTIDRRSDVYSLGATLYQLLTGQQIFAGTATEMLVQTVRDEPLPPRSHEPQLPADLQVIVLKCLAKEPSRRYSSARALEADLLRFLEGEPILAQPPSLGYRLTKRLRKHKTLTAVIALATVAILVLAAVAVRARWQAAREAEAAQRFTAEVKDLEWLLRAARMSPLHDMRPQQEEVRAQLEVLEAQAADLRPVSRGPALYALGRGHLALGQVDRAREFLESARQAGYQPPESAVSLGLVYGRLYRRALEAADGIADRKERSAARRRAEQGLRDPAIDLLASSRGATAVEPAYLEALIAFYNEELDTAATAAAEALRQAPWLYEAELLRGEVEVSRGDTHRFAGENDQATASYDRAAETFGRAATVAASAKEVYLRRCQLGAKRMELEFYGPGRDLTELLENTLPFCRLSLEVDPDHAATEVELATVWMLQAISQGLRGEDATEASAYVGKHSLRAVELDPQDWRAWHQLSTHFSLQAGRKREVGDDPREDLRAAAEAGRRGVAVARNPVLLFNQQGNVLNRLATLQMSSGEDPSGTLAQAVEAFEDALKLDPAYAYAWTNLGRSHTSQARWETSRGLDSRGSLRAAVAVYERALAINPDNASTHNNLGISLLDLGQIAMGVGEDPSSSLRQAEEAFGRSLEINPAYASAHNNVGLSNLYLARFKCSRGQDPAVELARAVASLEETIRLNSRAFQPHVNLGRVEAVRARFADLVEADPSSSLEGARSHYRDALERNPRYASGIAELAGVWLHEAAVQSRRGDNPETALERAIQLGTEALTIDADLVLALRHRAGAHLAQVETAIALESSRKALLKAVDEDIEQAFEIRPADVELTVLASRRASLRLASLANPSARRRQIADVLERAEQAVTRYGEHPELLVARGDLRIELSELEDNLELARAGRRDLERARELNPLLAEAENSAPTRSEPN